MILGILTAIIIAITKMVAPAIADGMIRYMERRVVYNSTVADGGADWPRGSRSTACERGDATAARDDKETLHDGYSGFGMACCARRST